MCWGGLACISGGNYSVASVAGLKSVQLPASGHQYPPTVILIHCITSNRHYLYGIHLPKSVMCLLNWQTTRLLAQ